MRIVNAVWNASAQRWWAVFLVAIAIIVLAVGVKYEKKASTPSRLDTLTRTAILRWQDQVRDLFAGKNVYKGNPYPNPPIMALILRPLYELPPIACALVWFALKVVMATISIIWIFQICRTSTPIWARILAITLALHPIMGDLSHGNVNIVILFLIAGTLEAYRRNRNIIAGLTLGLAIACKVTPALFLPYFIWKGAWRCVAATFVSLILWFVVVPSAVLGFDENTTLLTSWYDGMVRPFLVDGKITTERANQSIPGVTFRLLTDKPSELDYDEEGRPIPAEFHNVATIGVENARWIVRGFQALFVLAVVGCCRTPRVQRGGLAFAAECGLIVLGMLLFSERTWKHHGVTLLLPYAVLCLSLGNNVVPRFWRRVIAAILMMVAILTLLPSSLGDAGQDAMLIYGSYTWAYLLLAIGVCIVMLGSASRPTVGRYD